MRIEVIGYKGVVGGATYELFKRLGYAVTGSDKGDPVHRADIYVICTPEDAVPEIIDLLHVSSLLFGKRPIGSNVPVEDALIVIRSTVPIGTCVSLQNKYYPVHICHWPEHLKEATATWGAYYPAFNNIGECCKRHGDFLEDLLKPLAAPLLRSDVTTSEASKYAINNLKATIISYWNEFMLMGDVMEYNPHLAARIASHEVDIPRYGTLFGKAFSGKCLPKDIRATLATCKKNGFDPRLLRAVADVNEEIRKSNGESDIATT